MSGKRLTLLLSLAATFGGLALIETRAVPALMIPWQVLLVLGVIGLIALGADWMVDSACRIAAHFGVSNLVIGLTIVALGTSAPEIAASLVAGMRGHADITVANVIGSNIFNTCFILGGVAALVRSGLGTDRFLVLRDGPALLIGTAMLYLFVAGGGHADRPADAAFGVRLLNRQLETMEGILMLVGLGLYLWWLYRSRGGDRLALEDERRQSIEVFGPMSWRDGPLLVLGTAMVVGGCQLLVGEAEQGSGVLHGHGALWFAHLWEIPEYVIGVTIIAAGTSAPEFVVSLVAALRGAHGLSAGNLIGSNIFNTFGVVGVAGVVLQPPLSEPVRVSEAAGPSILGFALIVVVTIVFMRRGYRLTRPEGVILVLLGLLRWGLDFGLR
ncbi:MAG: calcium/sodium antiporter [Myxococcales bacterium]|jgi:cation:H+ antiporter